MVNIIVETTPNPATMKFIPGGPVMTEGTVNFASADTAAGSPLAVRLFGIAGVTGVFLGADFISVAKSEGYDWTELEPAVRSEIAEHLDKGGAVLSRAAGKEGAGGEEAPDARPVVAQIRELLDTRIRPSVALDGGDIVYRGFENGIVYLSLQGACVGCPSASATLKMGVENLLKHYVPDVVGVEAVA